MKDMCLRYYSDNYKPTDEEYQEVKSAYSKENAQWHKKIQEDGLNVHVPITLRSMVKIKNTDAILNLLDLRTTSAPEPPQHK